MPTDKHNIFRSRPAENPRKWKSPIRPETLFKSPIFIMGTTLAFSSKSGFGSKCGSPTADGRDFSSLVDRNLLRWGRKKNSQIFLKMSKMETGKRFRYSWYSAPHHEDPKKWPKKQPEGTTIYYFVQQPPPPHYGPPPFSIKKGDCRNKFEQ